MKAIATIVRGILLIATLGIVANGTAPAFAQPTNGVRIVELLNTVEVLTPGATDWVLTQTNQDLRPHCRVRTGTNSSVGILLSDLSVLRFKAMAEFEILPPDEKDKSHGLHLFDGIMSFFHRDKPGRIRIITSGAFAGVRGTEFVLEVTHTNQTERTTLSLIDGLVEFGNDKATLLLANGEQAIAEPGRAPFRTAGFNVTNLLQWCFYYPAVLDLKDLSLTIDEATMLTDSLTAYRTGDLLKALAQYPADRIPASDTERIYYAALLLSVGQVAQAETNLAVMASAGASEKNQRLANALRTLIAAVKREIPPTTQGYQLPTEFLAASYYEQSRAIPEVSLQTALQLARQVMINSPEFGFGWERVAELEFSFGRTDRASEALSKALLLSPRNAQALALQGFLLAAQNKTREAIGWFDRALAVDSALGNAWLGRGLCRIRRGDTAGGREDLLIAAAMEPQRAELRSYLGKAWSDAGDFKRATKELQLARTLDPRDPTAWLYSALNNEEQNRINEAIGDLEKSQELNENRSVYRSGLLLDQDSAVRSANLARIYQEAGMDDVALREASRAVSSDYANYSAHLFLANSYNALRDPNNINLRYETPTESEYLIANLLAPVGAGILSPSISQQDYSKLFERDRFGMSSSTEYLSRGAWTQSGSQFGTQGNFSYELAGAYRTDPGQRPNNDFEGKLFSLQFKEQLTPQDSIYFKVSHSDFSGGDLYQYYDPNTQLNPGLRVNEVQEPLLGLGYHHEWRSGVHTLILASYLRDDYEVSDSGWQGIEMSVSNGLPTSVRGFNALQTYQNTIDFYSIETQQIFERPRHADIFGALYQGANYDMRNLLELPFPIGGILPDPPADQHLSADFQRISIYWYHHWQMTDRFQIISGISYDHIKFPENFRSAPISSETTTIDRFSPKAGFVWTPEKSTVMRGAWTRSLGGAALDQSLRLEPTEVAGFNQSFRSIAPESIVGSTAGTSFETFDVSLEHEFPTKTYAGISAEMLHSSVRQPIGTFALNFPNDVADISSTQESLDFREQSLNATLDQLIGRWVAVGARYRLSHASLDDDLVNLDESIRTVPAYPVYPRYRPRSTLQKVTLQAVLNHSSGFSAGVYGSWYDQRNTGTQAPADDSFFQVNLLCGYRSPRNHLKLEVGLLNVTGQNYHLVPLNLYDELPRQRLFVTRLQLNF